MTPPAGDALMEIEEAAALDAALVGLLAAGHPAAAVVHGHVSVRGTSTPPSG